jgi:hypothetical protein
MRFAHPCAAGAGAGAFASARADGGGGELQRLVAWASGAGGAGNSAGAERPSLDSVYGSSQRLRAGSVDEAKPSGRGKPFGSGAGVAAALVALALARGATASRPVSKVHLALPLASDASRMRVGWTSAQGDVLGQGLSVVEWGADPRNLTERALGFNYSWIDFANPSGFNRTYTHNLAEMTGLAPGATVFYLSLIHISEPTRLM